MTSDNAIRRLLPDVASEANPAQAGALDWVGMDAVEMPVLLSGGPDDEPQRLSARIAVAVNLRRADARGIHMSRLYLQLDRHLSADPVTPASLRRLLRDFLASHEALSDRARVRLQCDYLVRRAALASDNSGWRAYPVTLGAQLDETGFVAELGLQIGYSSTCPASAALARQIIQERFAHAFGGDAPLDRAAVLAWLGSSDGIAATPHSQRSTARVEVRLGTVAGFPVIELIDRLEAALATPVQSAVKRTDEQAFALANGQNLMFCEDAARRLRAVLERDERILDYRIRAAHHESLHPHDAVATVSRGTWEG